MKRHGLSLLLLLLIAAGTLWLASRPPATYLATQVTELLPASGQEPGVQLVRSLASSEHARTLLVVLTGIAAPHQREQALRQLADALHQSPLIAEVWAVDHPHLPESVREIWRDHAVQWFWPHWWEAAGRPRTAETVAQSAVGALSAFLERPESLAWESAVTSDPFLLVPAGLRRLEQALPVSTSPGAGDSSRLWVQLSVSPFSAEGQQPVFKLLESAEQELRTDFPSASLRHTGTSHFAAASESAIRREISRLNLLVALSVGGLCALFVRRPLILLPLFLIVGATLLGGIAVSFIVFSRIHVFTLVIGSILIGVAVDYGLHVFLGSRNEPGKRRLDAVGRPLVVGALSTIGGFLALTFTSLPVLRQMGTFIAAGLFTALLVSLLYAARPETAPSPARFPGWLSRLPGRRLVVVVFLLLSPLLTGLLRIEWKDDIRELDYPVPTVQANDAAVRAAFGETDGERSLLLGPDWASVQAAASRLEDSPGSTATSLAPWVPGPELVAAAHQAARSMNLEPALQAELEENGYTAGAFEPFFSQWRNWTAEPWSGERYENTVRAQLASLPGPAALLSGTDGTVHWWMLEGAGKLTAPAGTKLVPLAQLESLNEVFSRYRREALAASLIGFTVLAAGLLAGFGPRAGAILVLLPLLPVLLTLGYFGWRGSPLNLFHLLGAFLAVCLTVDYLVFALQSRRRDAALPVSVGLSALTTAASFGWLATSGIPAVSALGWTVAPSVLMAWALALGLTAPPSRSELPGGPADQRPLSHEN